MLTYEISSLFVNVSVLPHNGFGFFQIIFLGFVYMYLLYIGSNLISDGSELLLLIPSTANIVGSIVLPILGSTPEMALVLFSCLGSKAQSNVFVGMGTIAGSSVMLLTLPWFSTIIGGRVNVINGIASYKFPKLSPPDKLDLFETGIAINPVARIGGLFIFITSLTYLIVEVAAVQYINLTTIKQVKSEAPYVLFGAVLSLLLLVSYLIYQFLVSDNLESKKLRDDFYIQSIKNGTISLLGIMTTEFENELQNSANTSEQSPLVTTDKLTIVVNRLKEILHPFFVKYDRDNSGSLDLQEISAVFQDLNEDIDSKNLQELFEKFDLDGSGSIEFEEFVYGVADFVLNGSLIKASTKEKHKLLSYTRPVGSSSNKKTDEVEDVPVDLQDMSPYQQQLRIKLRASWMLILGTILVVIVSAPMVEIFSELGIRTGIAPFYVAFVLAPIASNVTEIISSYNYSRKKTASSIAVSIAALQGSVVMNNTLVTTVFLFLIYTQGLTYQFFAETTSLLIIETLMVLYSLKSTHTFADACVILTFYPATLILVSTLQKAGYN